MKHSQLICILGIIALLCTVPAWGQITITSSDFPNTIGLRAVHSCSGSTAQINPGPAGANQTWDLQGIPVEESAEIEIVDRSSTPNPSWFPSANRILRAAGSGEIIATYTYEELTGSYLKNLGMAYTAAESSYATQWTNDPPYAPFPIQYQGSWMTRIYWEKSMYGFWMTSDDSAYITVDGWGTVILDEVGSRPCLRLKLHHHLVTTLNGIPTGDDWYWAYIWMTAGHGEGASMESETGADENFTDGYFCRWSGGAGAEEPVQFVPLAFELQNPYPNPFNPETTIPYSVKSLSNVELSIYNALGQKVRTLVNGQVLPGSYSIVWNAADDAGNSVGTGVYYCRLLTPLGIAPTQRLILLR